MRAMEDATGRSLEAFFDQWVMKGGHPCARGRRASTTTACFKLTVTQTQAKPGDHAHVFSFKLPRARGDRGGRERARDRRSARQRETFALRDRRLRRRWCSSIRAMHVHGVVDNKLVDGARSPSSWRRPTPRSRAGARRASLAKRNEPRAVKALAEALDKRRVLGGPCGVRGGARRAADRGRRSPRCSAAVGDSNPQGAARGGVGARSIPRLHGGRSGSRPRTSWRAWIERGDTSYLVEGETPSLARQDARSARGRGPREARERRIPCSWADVRASGRGRRARARRATRARSRRCSTRSARSRRPRCVARRSRRSAARVSWSTTSRCSCGCASRSSARWTRSTSACGHRRRGPWPSCATRPALPRSAASWIAISTAGCAAPRASRCAICAIAPREAPRRQRAPRRAREGAPRAARREGQARGGGRADEEGRRVGAQARGRGQGFAPCLTRSPVLASMRPSCRTQPSPRASTPPSPPSAASLPAAGPMLTPTSRSCSARGSARSPTRSRARSRIPYTDIPGMAGRAVAGHAGNLVIGLAEGVPSRRDAGARAPLRGTRSTPRSCSACACCSRLGARTVVVTNAAGGVEPRARARRSHADRRSPQPDRAQPAPRARTTRRSGRASRT